MNNNPIILLPMQCPECKAVEHFDLTQLSLVGSRVAFSCGRAVMVDNYQRSRFLDLKNVLFDHVLHQLPQDGLPTPEALEAVNDILGQI